MPIYIINILLGISFLTITILSTLIWFKSRLQSSIFLSLSAYGTSVWIIATLIYINANNLLMFTWSNKLLHVAGLIILTYFSSFAYTFLGPSIKENKKLFFSLQFFSFLFIFLIIFTQTIILNAEFITKTRGISFGPFFPYYALYIVSMAFLSYYYLIKKSFVFKSRIEKIQLVFIGLGSIISLSVGLILNIIIPYFGYFKYYWLGPFLSVIFVIFTFYAILKHHLFNIKLISVELFSGIILIMTLIDALLSKTRTELLLKLSLFVGIGVISILIIRSVLNEIRAKERITEISGELRNANIKLQKLDQAKSDFLSVTSHQLRTPMTVIKGYISLMQEGEFGKLSNKTKEAMDRIYVSNERLIKLLNDLLDLSRIERGKMNYNFEKYSLAKIVEDAVRELMPVAENKKLKLSYNKPEEYLPEILLDKEYIRQVVTNLLDNAIKYTDNGGKEIEVSFSSTPEKVTLQIKDTGKGITPERMNQLFKRYERGGNEKKFATHVKGLGLGLYVAKMIIDDHQGRIWAESEGEGKGSTFFVELPVG